MTKYSILNEFSDARIRFSYVSFSDLSRFVGIPHVKNYITNDEYSYLVIWIHTVISINSIKAREYYKSSSDVANKP